MYLSSVQSLSRVRLFANPWTTALQASLSITNSRSPPMSIESVMPSTFFVFLSVLKISIFRKTFWKVDIYLLPGIVIVLISQGKVQVDILSKPYFHRIYFLRLCLCLLTQSCLTLCNPMDCSPPASSVHGISQARILEWVAIPFSRDLPDPGIESRYSVLQVDSLPSRYQWSPSLLYIP